MARVAGIIWGYVRPIGDIPVHISPMTTDFRLKRRGKKVEKDEDEHPDRNDSAGWDDPWFSIDVGWRDHPTTGHLVEKPNHPVNQDV
jgi:hypothetical protein